MTTVAGVLGSLVSDDESSTISLMNSLLILTFAVSVLLLTLAAVPPTWSGRFAFSARLYNVRGPMVMAGGILLLESGLLALMLTT
jgi:hypothetical protein